MRNHSIRTTVAAISVGALANVKASSFGDESPSSSSSSAALIGIQTLQQHRAGGGRSEKSQARKLQSFCTSCHVADDESSSIGGGPDVLSGKTCIFDKPAATADTKFPYSETLKNSGVVWNDDTLDDWLTNPQLVVNGTSCEGLGDDPEKRQDIINSLKEACGIEVTTNKSDDNASSNSGAARTSSRFSARTAVVLGAGLAYLMTMNGGRR